MNTYCNNLMHLSVSRCGLPLFLLRVFSVIHRRLAMTLLLAVLAITNGAQITLAGDQPDLVFGDGFEIPALSFVSVPVSVALTNTLFTYEAEALDPGGRKLIYALINSPAGMTIDADTGVIEWTPDVAGDYPVTVEASNDAGASGRQSWTIRVVLPAPGFAMVDDGWTLTESSLWSESPPSISDPSIMDVDQDGLPDIIYNGPLYDNTSENGWVDQVVPFRWLKNVGDGIFVEGNQSFIPESSALTHTRHMRVEDFNQDGFDDLVAVSHGYDVPPFPMERNLVLLSRSGQPLVDSELGNSDFDYLGFSHGLDTGDINGDGAKDIVVADLFEESDILQNKVRILINDGSGKFVRDTSAIQINEQTGVLDVALVDLNGDGADELIFGSWRDELESQIFWNDGAGKLSQKYTVLPKLSVNGVDQYDTLAIANTDLNFDGFPDLILSVSRDYERGYIQFLVNNGDRTFTDATDQYSLGETFHSPGSWIHIHDFNGDTLDDLLIGVTADPYNNSNTNNLWLRVPSGGFEKYTLPLNEVNDWGESWPIDYDLDGDIDLVFRYPLRYYEGYFESPKWRTVENKLIDK